MFQDVRSVIEISDAHFVSPVRSGSVNGHQSEIIPNAPLPYAMGSIWQHGEEDDDREYGKIIGTMCSGP